MIQRLLAVGVLMAGVMRLCRRPATGGARSRGAGRRLRSEYPIGPGYQPRQCPGGAQGRRMGRHPQGRVLPGRSRRPASRRFACRSNGPHMPRPTPLTRSTRSSPARVDWAVDQALANKLNIIVNVHHYDEMNADPESTCPGWSGCGSRSPPATRTGRPRCTSSC